MQLWQHYVLGDYYFESVAGFQNLGLTVNADLNEREEMRV